MPLNHVNFLARKFLILFPYFCFFATRMHFFEIRVNFLLLIRLTIFFGMSYLEDTEIKKTNLNLLGLKQLALKTKAFTAGVIYRHPRANRQFLKYLKIPLVNQKTKTKK